MDVTPRELKGEKIEDLTYILHRRPEQGVAVPEQKWLDRQKRKVNDLHNDNQLKRPPLVKRLSVRATKFIKDEEVDPAGVSCAAHKELNKYLIRRIFMTLVTEVTIHISKLRSFPDKKPGLAALVQRLDAVNAYWVSKNGYLQTFSAPPYDERIFTQVLSGCEACILAMIGGNGRVLADLAAHMRARYQYCVKVAEQQSREGRSRWAKKPSLLRFVERWINYFNNAQRDKVLGWRDGLIRELMPIEPYIRNHRAGGKEYSMVTVDEVIMLPKHLRRNQEQMPVPKPRGIDEARHNKTVAGSQAGGTVGGYDDYDSDEEYSASDSTPTVKLAPHPDNISKASSPHPDNASKVSHRTMLPPHPDNVRASQHSSNGPPTQSFIKEFEHEIPLPQQRHDTSQPAYNAVSYTGGLSEDEEDELEGNPDAERDPRAEERSREKVSNWYNKLAKHQSKPNLRDEDLHPAFRVNKRSVLSVGGGHKQDYSASSAVPPALSLGSSNATAKPASSYVGARALWSTERQAQQDHLAPPRPSSPAKTELRDVTAASSRYSDDEDDNDERTPTAPAFEHNPLDPWAFMRANMTQSNIGPMNERIPDMPTRSRVKSSHASSRSNSRASDRQQPPRGEIALGMANLEQHEREWRKSWNVRDDCSMVPDESASNIHWNRDLRSQHSPSWSSSRQHNPAPSAAATNFDMFIRHQQQSGRY